MMWWQQTTDVMIYVEETAQIEKTDGLFGRTKTTSTDLMVVKYLHSYAANKCHKPF